MSSLDLELDSRIDDLELEWRQAHEANVIARAEGLEARIFAKIELLEDSMLGLG
jgi:hypothetical protein